MKVRAPLSNNNRAALLSVGEKREAESSLSPPQLYLEREKKKERGIGKSALLYICVYTYIHVHCTKV